MTFTKKYFEIKLESIGGLGANLAGKILGELGAMYMDLNATNFSSYGSEKRGSPVKSFIRYAKKDNEIKINTPIKEPDILAIFHLALAGKKGLLAGVNEKTKVIVNSSHDPEKTRDILKMYAGELYCIDALKYAEKAKSKTNMVILGAIAKASGFISLDILKQVVKDTVGKKYPDFLENNLNAIQLGYDNIVFKAFSVDNKYNYEKYEEIEREWGYESAPIGGINPAFGSTVSNDLSSSRSGLVPVFNKEKCINCGLCDTTCPDLVYQFVPGEYKGKKMMVNLGIDYHHCKGCMRCVEVCPTNAITEEKESDIDIKKMHIRNQSLLVKKMDFEDVGANSWINEESYTENSLE